MLDDGGNQKHVSEIRFQKLDKVSQLKISDTVSTKIGQGSLASFILNPFEVK